MKKTLIALMALAGVAMANEWTFSSTMLGDSSKETTVHGFTFNLSSELITGETAVSTLPETVYLTSLTMQERAVAGTQRNVGLLVLDTSNTILGWSNELCSTSESTNIADNTFTFTNLLLDTNTTYRFVTVSNVSNLTSSYIGYTYAYGKDATYTSNAEAKTLTGGLTSADVAVDVHSNTDYNLNYTTSESFASVNGSWSPILTSVKVTDSIPEPATATLSLLALAGLAARRRRK